MEETVFERIGLRYVNPMGGGVISSKSKNVYKR